MRFIEKTMPVENLNPVALAEGNAKKPVYQMHKWWARRLGSVFRMITLSAFGGEHETETETWRKFCEGADLKGAIVLDPFMGGGTTIAEALRLGCKVVGQDINPVAWFVTKKEVEPVNLHELDSAFHELRRTAGERIRTYYATSCPQGHHAEVMYYFWVKVADCGNCGSKQRLFPNYELSRRDNAYVCLCPNCLQVIETSAYDPESVCQGCETVFDPRKGIAGRGVFRCSECGGKQSLLEAVERKGGALDMDLHGLEGYCEHCGRFFKRIDVDDKHRWSQVKAEFEKCMESLLFPRQRIPTEGRSDPRPVNHGYQFFWQMFNERQLVCLSILLTEILKIPERNIRELMLTAFSDSLDTNNMFCKYEISWHKISAFFGLHAFHPIERPTENNVWGTRYGRGTFVRCFEKVRRAKAFCQAPYERLLNGNGKRYSKPIEGERISGELVEGFNELELQENAALLRCGSSEDLSHLPDESVDAVITDPPYFDNVQYSELADFFYVWLRLGLKESYQWFVPEFSRQPREIVKNDKLGKTAQFFNDGLGRVFTECNRTLKEDGLLIFTFHHKQNWAWEGIAQLLLDAGFYISATPIVRSEGKSGFHSSDGNIRYDCVLVCRKLPCERMAWDWSWVKKSILDDAVSWTRRTLDSGMPINEVDVYTIVMGKTVEYYTKTFDFIQTDGSALTLEVILKEMADVVGYVNERFNGDSPEFSGEYADQVKQLRFYIMTSKAHYTTRKSSVRV